MHTGHLPWDHAAIQAFVSLPCGWATLAGVPGCPWHRGAIFGCFLAVPFGYGVSTSDTRIPRCILAYGSVTEDLFPLFPPFVTPAPLDYVEK